MSFARVLEDFCGLAIVIGQTFQVALVALKSKLVGLLSLFSLFGIFGIVDLRRHVLEYLLGRNLSKICQKMVEIQPWRLENQALEPPKSSQEASKTPFLKDI